MEYLLIILSGFFLLLNHSGPLVMTWFCWHTDTNWNLPKHLLLSLSGRIWSYNIYYLTKSFPYLFITFIYFFFLTTLFALICGLLLLSHFFRCITVWITSRAKWATKILTDKIRNFTWVMFELTLKSVLGLRWYWLDVHSMHAYSWGVTILQIHDSKKKCRPQAG